MGASVLLEWPEITSAIQDNAPFFANDCKAWASWLASAVASRKASRILADLGFDPLLSHNTDGLAAKKIKWQTPQEFAAAADGLRVLVAAGDRRVVPLVEIYAQDANGVDPPSEELCQDLAEVTEIARYAVEHGADKMTLGYYW